MCLGILTGVECRCLHTTGPVHTTPIYRVGAPRARAMHESPPRKFTKSRARAAWGVMRQFPIAQLDSMRTVGGQTRGVVGSRVAHMWYTNEYGRGTLLGVCVGP